MSKIKNNIKYNKYCFVNSITLKLNYINSITLKLNSIKNHTNFFMSV